jgi:hypothetical protein
MRRRAASSMRLRSPNPGGTRSRTVFGEFFQSAQPLMHLKSLKIYCDIVDKHSFSRAAEANGVSQSNASQVVHHLEEDLGVQLIDRSRRPFRLTPEGERFHEGSRVIVQRN